MSSQNHSVLKAKAVFLDRDGTLNHDPGYLNDPERVSLFPGTREGLTKLKQAGFLLIVVSNQSGVARGLIQPERLSRIHDRINELLGADLAIDDFTLCLHHPDTDCECRKPKPKLLLDAAARLNVDVSRSYMVGDRISDVLAGKSAGCKGSILVRTGHGAEDEGKLSPGDASFIGDSLLDVADWILRQETADS